MISRAPPTLLGLIVRAPCLWAAQPPRILELRTQQVDHVT
jgi:hypothetical protein